jgi:hypothetical protein
MLPFDGTSIMVPEPLVFPRQPYAEALDVHAQLLARYEGVILSKAQEEGTDDDPFCFLSEKAGTIIPRPKGVAVDVLPRPHAATMMRKYHGILRELFLDRGALRFPVVVLARGVISLHTLAIEDPRGTPRLVVVSRNDVMEPQKQEHREEGPWIITRWVAHDREPRYAWRPTPVEPASREEAIDRVLALRGALLQEEVEAFLRSGKSPGETFAYMKSGVLGDSCSVSARLGRCPLTWRYPKIEQVLATPADPRYVTVFLDGHEWGALWWMDPHATEGGAAPPPRIVESRAWSMTDDVDTDDGLPSDDDDDDDDEAPPEAPPATPQPGPAAPGPAQPEAPPPAPEKPRRQLSAMEMVEALDRLGIDFEVERLVKLTKEQLDREIAEAGFDPALEREKGPGVREQVVLAMLDREGAEEDDEEEGEASSGT